MDLTKPRLLVVLPSQKLFDNFTLNDCFSRLKDKFDLTMLIPKQIQAEDCEFVAFRYSESRLGRIFRELMLNVETIRLSSIHKSFKTRVSVIFPLSVSKICEEGALKKENVFKIMRFPRTAITLIVYFSPKKIQNLIYKTSLIWPSLTKVMLSLKPEVTLLVSGGAYSGIENTVIRKLNQRNIPTCLVIDNWDNLSSKSIISECPTGLGVWGPNMYKDATIVHEMNPKVTSYLGSSRFKSNESNYMLTHGANFILFAGSGKPEFDELEFMLGVRNEVCRNIQFRATNIIYRPHPARISQENGRFIEYRKLINPDKDLSESNQVFIDLNSNLQSEYLVTLLRQAKFVIAPQSTLIVESLSVGTPVISWVPHGPRSEIHLYSHFDEVIENPSFYVCDSMISFKKAVKSISLDLKREKQNYVPEILPEFTNTYAERLNELVFATFKAGFNDTKK